MVAAFQASLNFLLLVSPKLVLFLKVVPSAYIYFTASVTSALAFTTISTIFFAIIHLPIKKSVLTKVNTD
jgi:hypothetical protein